MAFFNWLAGAGRTTSVVLPVEPKISPFSHPRVYISSEAFHLFLCYELSCQSTGVVGSENPCELQTIFTRLHCRLQLHVYIKHSTLFQCFYFQPTSRLFFFLFFFHHPFRKSLICYMQSIVLIEAFHLFYAMSYHVNLQE